MRPNRRSVTGDEAANRFTPRERPQAVGSNASAFAGESPARALQGTLASRVSDGFAMDADEQVERWPRAHRLLFLIGSASALWGITIGLAALATALVK